MTWPMTEVIFPFDSVLGRHRRERIWLQLEAVGQPPSLISPVDPKSLTMRPANFLRIIGRAQRGMLSGGQIAAGAVPDDQVVFDCEVDNALWRRPDFNALVRPTTGVNFLLEAVSEDGSLKFKGRMLVRIAPRLQIALTATPAIANADGRPESIVKLTPQVTMDGSPYPGEIYLRYGADREAEPSPESLDNDYFTVIGFDPRGFDILSLRCKLRFACDPAMRALGASRQLQAPGVAFDKLPRLAVYFKDWRDNQLFPNGLTVDNRFVNTPATITLRPSTVTVTADDVELPKSLASPPRLFTTTLRVRARSADGRLLPAGELPKLQSPDYWRLRLEFDPPPTTHPEAAEQKCDEIDAAGNVLFYHREHYKWRPSGNEGGEFFVELEDLNPKQPDYQYDHEEWCWNKYSYRFEVPVNPAQKTLGDERANAGPTVKLIARFGHTVDYEDNPAEVLIGVQRRAVSVSWDYTRFVLDPGAAAPVAYYSYATLAQFLIKRGYQCSKVKFYYTGTPLDKAVFRNDVEKLFALEVPKPKDPKIKEWNWHFPGADSLAAELRTNGITAPVPATYDHYTVLIKQHDHHGIMISTAAEPALIAHFLAKQPYSRFANWLNRDQVRDRETSAATGPYIPLDNFDEGRVYHDTFDLFVDRGYKGSKWIEAWYP